MLCLGDDIVPKAIYGGIKVYNSPGIYIEPTTKILAHLTLNDGSIVDIEDDGTGVLKQSMTSGYKSTCVSAVITDNCIELGRNAFSVNQGTQNSILTSLTISDSVKVIGDDCVLNCSALTECHIGTGVTEIRHGAFARTYALEKLILPASLETVWDRAFSNRIATTAKTLHIYSLAVTPPTFKQTGTKFTLFEAHQGKVRMHVPCESLSDYKAAAGWNEIPSYYSCFDILLKLTDESIVPLESDIYQGDVMPYKDTLEEVLFMYADSGNHNTDSAFEGFTNLKKANIYGIDDGYGSNYVELEMVTFMDCTALTEVNIITTIVEVDDGNFYNCKSLTGINTNADYIRLGFGYYHFAGCENLKQITSPVLLLHGFQYTDCFSGCTNLKEITLMPDTTSETVNDTLATAFNNSNIEKIYVPADWLERYKTAWPSLAQIIYPIS